ncbi:hypothetical protein BFP72_18660 [Reichenbachiella sp. 5M10]|uniref:DUF4271 domain-containing protein n=1 Tax=Reichenbachiella sp. 5M10 TaxID=1889772 RepID=UPI000C159592|nr:DUF4271 domain-containing protein [Reichenbachiella sp. 5M10]PIB37287.1 hypothetical protein BFP72_18660 [Reichenbachiella sp. 5M10]
MRNLVSFFFVGLLLLIGQAAWAQKTLHVVEDLKYSWKSYDEKLEQWIPYLSTSESHAVAVVLDLNDYQGSELLLVCPEGYSLFIQGQLVHVTADSDSLFWSIDSLKEAYRSPRIRVGLFSQQWQAAQVQTQVVRRAEHLLFEGEGLMHYWTRGTRKNGDVMILSSLLIFAMMVIFRTSLYRSFREYFSIGRAFAVRQRFELIASQSPFSLVNIGFMLLYALFVGGTMINVLLKFPAYATSTVWGIELSSASAVMAGVYASGGAFVAILLKAPLIEVLTRVFNFQKYSEVHFFAYFRLSLLIAFFSFLGSILLFVSSYSVSLYLFEVFQWGVLSLLVTRLVLMYLVLNNHYSFRKLHLISYLCSSEIIPLIIFVKTLLGK